MYTDEQICLGLIRQLYPLVKSRVAVIRSCIVNTDILIAVIKNRFQLQHNSKVNIFFVDSLFRCSRRSSTMPGIHNHDFVIDFMRRQKTEVKTQAIFAMALAALLL